MSCLMLLLLLSACYGPQRQRMLALLDEADSLNRAYAQLPSDTLLRQAADFFDRHGTANEQLRAHYLLGCAYRDMGETPQAIQCYLDAVDRADTLSNDCDLQRLMAVYGQMAELYHAQHLPLDELFAAQKYGQYALCAKDTLKYIRNLELISKVYDLLGDTVRMLGQIEKAQKMYEASGYHQEAVQTYAAPIYVAIYRGELDSAFHMTQVYETESGLFDSTGIIKTGREGYYYFKGLYFLRKGNLDEAEKYMRMMIGTAEEVNGYRGLMAIYRQRENVDSTAHYANLFECALDAKNNRRETDIIHQMSALYNYQRSERVASQKTFEALRLRLVAGALLTAALIMVAFFIVRIRSMRKREQIAMTRYLENVEELRQARTELVTLRSNEYDNGKLIAAREEKIGKLESLILEYQKREANAPTDTQKSLEEEEIYRHFHVLANKGRKPTDEDWNRLVVSIRELMPEMGKLLQRHETILTVFEYQICILIRLHIKPTQIGRMFNVSGSYVSQVRRDLLKKVFKKEGKPGEFDNCICDIS